MSTWGPGSVEAGSASVGTASAQLLAANPDRRWLRLTNLGTASAYLSLGTAPAVVGEGVALLAEAGGRVAEFTRGAGSLWSGAIQGIASVDGVAVSYVEGSDS